MDCKKYARVRQRLHVVCVAPLSPGELPVLGIKHAQFGPISPHSEKIFFRASRESANGQVLAISGSLSGRTTPIWKLGETSRNRRVDMYKVSVSGIISADGKWPIPPRGLFCVALGRLGDGLALLAPQGGQTLPQVLVAMQVSSRCWEFIVVYVLFASLTMPQI